jgi:hypothetical protein
MSAASQSRQERLERLKALRDVKNANGMAVLEALVAHAGTQYIFGATSRPYVPQKIFG